MEGPCYRLRRKRSPSPDENHPPAKKQKFKPPEACHKVSPPSSTRLASGIAGCKNTGALLIQVTASQGSSTSSSPVGGTEQGSKKSSSSLGSLMTTSAPLPVTPPPSQPIQHTSDRRRRGMVMAPSPRQEQALCESSGNEDGYLELRDQLLTRQGRYAVDPYYMSRHPALTWGMRAILIDWLAEVCGLHSYCRQTLHLCVINFDRYMSRVEHITPDRLQLVGCACLFIAAKMEEVQVPHAANLAYLTEGGCTCHEILQCEQRVLRALDFEILPVTPNTWADLLVQQCVTTPTKHLGVTQLRTILMLQVMQVIDLAVLDKQSLTYPPHLLAAAACHSVAHNSRLAESLGIGWSVLSPVSDWMSPFATVLSQSSKVGLDMQAHMQQHIRGLKLLEAVDKVRKEETRPPTPANSECDEAPLSLSCDSDGPLTPNSDCELC